MINSSINIANILTIIRILLAPLMLWFLVDRNNSLLIYFHYSWLDYFAAFIFVVASITDFFDGFIARKYNQISTLGQILDPLADKMLMLAGFLGLLVLNRIDVFIIFLILSREFFITGLRILAQNKNITINSSFCAKTKTVVQMIAIGFLIMNWPYGTIILYIALFLTLYSGYEYIKEFIIKS
jgi:CDP-diacylglycerol---glycerol-3-phosphate 3-phosphatidyltransferase